MQCEVFECGNVIGITIVKNFYVLLFNGRTMLSELYVIRKSYKSGTFLLSIKMNTVILFRETRALYGSLKFRSHYWNA